jgi:hypothetical protein
MNKPEVIEFFGGTSREASQRLGISEQALSKWSEDLSINIENRIIATAVRKGFLPRLLKAFPELKEY